MVYFFIRVSKIIRLSMNSSAIGLLNRMQVLCKILSYKKYRCFILHLDKFLKKENLQGIHKNFWIFKKYFKVDE